MGQIFIQFLRLMPFDGVAYRQGISVCSGFEELPSLLGSQSLSRGSVHILLHQHPALLFSVSVSFSSSQGSTVIWGI